MLGRTHALSGAAVWLGCCAAASALGHHPAGATVVVGSVVCAGMALLPDVDHPESLVAGTFGPMTRLAAVGVARVTGGHRHGTHTAVFAAGVGLAVATVCLLGRWAVAGVVFAAAGLALRGLLPARDRYRAGPLTLTAIAAGAALACAWVPGASWWWLGLPAGLGCLVHCLGDALTHSGIPLLWPLPIRGDRWYRVGTPEIMRFATGGPVEAWLVLPALVAGGALSGAVALGVLG